MLDPATCIKDLLLIGGIGSFTGSGPDTTWHIEIGALPDEFDQIILVNVSGGKDPMPNWLLNFPSTQVMVRGTKGGYVAASNQIRAIVKALLGISSVQVGGSSGDMYRSITQVGDVAYLGQDANNRPMFVANFNLIVEPFNDGTGNRLPIS